MKKGISAVLALVLLLSMCSIGAVAAGKNKTYEGTIKATGGEQKYVYSDDYFKESSYKYSNKVALAASYLSYCSQNEEDNNYETYDALARSFWKTCGYGKIESNEAMLSKPDRDTYGVSIASKKAKINGKDYTLISVLQRGAGYEAEWASDVKIGTSGDHTGFAEAGDIAYDFLVTYLKNHPEITGNIKIWTGGHSRGGAAANMMCAKLDKFLFNGGTLRKGISLKREDIYCYTFESPLCAETGKTTVSYKRIYNNIHNILLRSDIVTYIPPADMGVARYGVEHYLPVAGDKDFDKINAECLKQLPDNDDWSRRSSFYGKFWPVTVTPNGTVDTIIRRNENSTETQTTFLHTTLPKLNRGIGGREGYAELEGGLYELLGTIFYTFGRDSRYEDVLADFAFRIQENASELFFSLFHADQDHLVWQLEKLLNESLKEKGGATYDTDEVHELISGAVKVLIPLAKAYPDEIATLICNIYNIILNHFLEYDASFLHVLPEDYLATHSSLAELPLTDVEKDNKYYDAINYTYHNGLMIGCGTQFFPDQGLTRAELAVVLYRLAGMPKVDISNLKWTDINERNTGTLVRKAITWAAKEGYVQPASSTRYSKYDGVSGKVAISALQKVLGKDKVAASRSVKNLQTISRGQTAALLYQAKA